MNCVCRGSDAATERSEVTAQGYRRFRCRACGRQFNERSAGVLNRTCLPSDIIAFVVICLRHYRLMLGDLSGILALRGIEVSHEAIRDWETKLLPVMGDALRKHRHGTRCGPGTSWYVDRDLPEGLRQLGLPVSGDRSRRKYLSKLRHIPRAGARAGRFERTNRLHLQKYSCSKTRHQFFFMI